MSKKAASDESTVEVQVVLDETPYEEQLESSKLVLEQAQFLLEDEIGYATALRTQRRTLSGLLAIVIGLGVFRIDLYGSPDDVPLLPSWSILFIRILLVVAVFFILWGTWSLYSERPVSHDGSAAPREGDPERPSRVPLLEEGKGSAALCVLDLDRKYRRTLEKARPLDTVRARTLILGVAYDRLATANRRIRYRIQKGKVRLFVSMILLLGAFLLYSWTLGERDGLQEAPTPEEATEDDRGTDARA